MQNLLDLLTSSLSHESSQKLPFASFHSTYMKRMIYESLYRNIQRSHLHTCLHTRPHTASHLEEHVQRDDSLPQGLTEVVDGVINGILLGVQVEDPVRRAGGEVVDMSCGWTTVVIESTEPDKRVWHAGSSRASKNTYGCKKIHART